MQNNNPITLTKSQFAAHKRHAFSLGFMLGSILTFAAVYIVQRVRIVEKTYFCTSKTRLKVKDKEEYTIIYKSADGKIHVSHNEEEFYTAQQGSSKVITEIEVK